jgi:hypothetical protein
MCVARVVRNPLSEYLDTTASDECGGLGRQLFGYSAQDGRVGAVVCHPPIATYLSAEKSLAGWQTARVSVGELLG